MEILKKSRVRYTRARHSGDIMIDAKGAEALSQERIPLIGGFKDHISSGGQPSKRQQFVAGITDELWGTDAWIDGARKDVLDVLGGRKETTRLRTKKIHITDFD